MHSRKATPRKPAKAPSASAVAAPAIDTGGDSVFTVRSTRPDTADRPAWTPPGPNYTSTYREGLNVTDPVRLVVQLDLDYK